MRSKDICLRPFAYNFDFFPTWYNPCHFSHTDISPVHYPIRFISNLLFLPTPLNNSPIPGLAAPPNNIIWLYFDSVIHSFGFQLTSWPGSIV